MVTLSNWVVLESLLLGQKIVIGIDLTYKKKENSFLFCVTLVCLFFNSTNKFYFGEKLWTTLLLNHG